MAWKGRKDPPDNSVDFATLFTTLLQAKLQDKNPALYQTIEGLIKRTQQSTGQINSVLNSFVGSIRITDDTNLQAIINAISTINAILADGTFLTDLDEQFTLPSSRRLMPGIGITFDDSVPFEKTINATSGAGSVFYTPLTDGNIDETDLIFAVGECIMVAVPI